jgi:hypothetical protein
MSQNIEVKFRVSGTELSSYISDIQKKGEALGNSAIRSAMEQTKASKEQLAIINQIFVSTERKTKLDIESARAVAAAQKESSLKRNQEDYFKQREQVNTDRTLTHSQRLDKYALTDVQKEEKDKEALSTYKEQLKVLHEQEKQSKLQTLVAREQIQTAKEASREQVKSIRDGDQKITDVYQQVGKNANDEEKLTL